MTFDEAKEIARKGIKVTHELFTKDEYLTMSGNMIIFEDGVRIFADEWIEGKKYMKVGWSLFK
jgi:hypothetical protein